MRLVLLTITITLSVSAFGQINDDNPIIRDINIFYSDTVDNKITMGNIEATGVIRTADNGYLISTIFSIYFPEAHDSELLKTDLQAYLAKSKLYASKSHISSGSVIKLNQELKKEWEIKFDSRRITDIMKLNNESFLISGERVDLKKIWVARLKIEDGSIQWLKEFKTGYHVSVSDSRIDKNGNVYILGEAERLKPILIEKAYGKTKIRFLKVTDSRARLTLTKVSSSGNEIWSKSIDSRKYNHFGYSLCISPDKIFASGTYGEEFNIYTLTPNGKIIAKIKTESADLLTYDNGLIFSTTKVNNDTVKIFRLTNSIDLLSTWTIPSDRKDVRIESMLTESNKSYLYGSMQVENKAYLLCSLDAKYQPESYWIYQKADYNSIVDLIEMGEDKLLIVGWCYSKDNDKIYKYLNLVEVKKTAHNTVFK